LPLADSAVTAGGTAGPAASGVVRDVFFGVEQDAETVGCTIAALAGSSRASVLAAESWPLAVAFLDPPAGLACVALEPVVGLLLVPEPGLDDVEVGVGVGVGGVVSVGVGLGLCDGVGLLIVGALDDGGKIVDGGEVGVEVPVEQFEPFGEPDERPDRPVCGNPDCAWERPGPPCWLLAPLWRPECSEPLSELLGDATCENPAAM
jgi:hypothetical protein